MKKIIPLLAAGAVISLATSTFTSCITKTTGAIGEDSIMVDSDSIVAGADTITIETQKASKENKYAETKLELSLPVGNGVAQTIREDMLKYISKEVYACASFGEDAVTGPVFSGSTKNITAVCDFYNKGMFKVLEKQGKEYYEERVNDIYSDDNDETITEEDRKKQVSEIAPYESELSLKLDNQTEKYIVFAETTYGYCGGAHGSASVDYLIYSKKDGKRIKTMLKKGVTAKMQRLIKNGLKQYFSDSGEKVKTDNELMENLLLADDSKLIPLPQTVTIPTKDGLLFVYGQYEIAAYAAGMPSFTIPYDKVKPFLTDEALELIEK